MQTQIFVLHQNVTHTSIRCHITRTVSWTSVTASQTTNVIATYWNNMPPIVHIVESSWTTGGTKLLDVVRTKKKNKNKIQYKQTNTKQKFKTETVLALDVNGTTYFQGHKENFTTQKLIIGIRFQYASAFYTSQMSFALMARNTRNADHPARRHAVHCLRHRTAVTSAFQDASVQMEWSRTMKGNV